MKVNFYATLRQITGQKTIQFDLEDGITVQELLDAILLRFPRMRDELVDENGRLYGHVHLFVNGRDSRFLDRNMETQVNAADRVDVFPAVGGG